MEYRENIAYIRNVQGERNMCKYLDNTQNIVSG